MSHRVAEERLPGPMRGAHHDSLHPHPRRGHRLGPVPAIYGADPRGAGQVPGAIHRPGRGEHHAGGAASRRLALVEFPSLDLAKEFYASPEYQAAKALRDGACEAEFIALDGL